jgi:hypothetical protein
VDNSFIGIKDTQANEANLSTDTDEPKLTLAQRQKIQRQRQLLVLREEGLIKNQNVESPRRGSVVSRNSGKS